MDEAIIDSDIVSELIKAKNPRVLHIGAHYLSQHQRFAFSAITFYEVCRGFLSIGAVARLTKFVQFAAASEVSPVSLPIFCRAAELWSQAYRGGHSRDDADIIIATTALESNRTLVTGNTAHFAWIPGLAVTDWRSGSP